MVYSEVGCCPGGEGKGLFCGKSLWGQEPQCQKPLLHDLGSGGPQSCSLPSPHLSLGQDLLIWGEPVMQPGPSEDTFPDVLSWYFLPSRPFRTSVDFPWTLSTSSDAVGFTAK